MIDGSVWSIVAVSAVLGDPTTGTNLHFGGTVGDLHTYVMNELSSLLA